MEGDEDEREEEEEEEEEEKRKKKRKKMKKKRTTTQTSINDTAIHPPVENPTLVSPYALHARKRCTCSKLLPEYSRI
eukprot:3549767-Pyramimonas_sp.AAC.1